MKKIISKNNVKITLESESEDDINAILIYLEAFGEKRHSKQKLQEQDVVEMRRLGSEGWGRDRLSKKFKVGKTTVERILKRQSWKHIA